MTYVAGQKEFYAGRSVCWYVGGSTKLSRVGFGKEVERWKLRVEYAAARKQDVKVEGEIIGMMEIIEWQPPR